MKRYIVTDEDIYEQLRLAIEFAREEEIEINGRGINERFIPARDAVNNWQREMRRFPVPDWTTHFAELVTVFVGHGEQTSIIQSQEIPK